MVVCDGRGGEARFAAIGFFSAPGAFKHAPAEIRTHRPMGLKVHFFPFIFANVADIHVAGETIEREAPRVPESE